MKKLNVIFFITDGHRADCLGCYGNPILQTPNIDNLAAEGVRFSNSFCSHSVCMPTRASIFTGRYPHVHRVWANGVPLPKSEITLPQFLAENGYATCAAGKIHFEPQGAPDYPPPIEKMESYYGFQEVHLNENRQGIEYLRFVEQNYPELLDAARKRQPIPEGAHELTWVVDRAIDFIRRKATEGKPFFCSCSFHELVPPCHPPETFANLYKPEDVPPPKVKEGELDNKPPYYRECYEGYLRRGRHPDEPTLRKYLASYYNQIAFIDKLFGRLVSAVKELGLWDETIILFTSDHGLVLNDHYQWRHGPFLYDQVIRVPMIWRIPNAPSGTVRSELVESIDIMPTVLDFLGIEPPAGVQGQSLKPLLLNEQGAKGKEFILAQDRESPELLARGIDPTGFRMKCIRTKDWKLIHYPNRPHGELYDLRNDPDEFDNLWHDPAYADKRIELERLLLNHLCETEDPLPERKYNA